MVDLITIATIEKLKESLTDMEENVEPPSECCVYRVPKDLRKVNEEAYTPKVISIGPLHHGKRELADMEKQKVRYQREFSTRITTIVWQEFITFIENNENRIRNCYAEMPTLPKLDFITMILYDAAFIIEFFLRAFERKDDFFINKPRVSTAVVIDLVLLENQLPYFVIKELYMLAFPNGRYNERQYPPFFLLSCISILDSLTFGIFEEVEVKHFTDLRRYAMTKTFAKPRPRAWLIDLPSVVIDLPSAVIDLPSAVKLHKSGVKFKKSIEGECLLDIRFEKKNPQIPGFEVGELRIPQFGVFYETECVVRNVMALEQCHYPNETHVCNFMHLMDFLVNTEEDVNLLVEAGILYNSAVDDTRIAHMFNKLCQQIYLSPSCYRDIARNLKEHHANSWNHAKATLENVYFGNPWRGAGTIAAIVLLILTLTQTICSILQVV